MGLFEILSCNTHLNPKMFYSEEPRSWSQNNEHYYEKFIMYDTQVHKQLLGRDNTAIQG